MPNKKAFRHELKYQITMADYLAIRQRLRPVMKPDDHAKEDGRYTIRSIYFDNSDDKALREKINGIQKREKFRIRYYNDDLTFLALEKKIKWNNLCQKTTARLTKEEVRSLLGKEKSWMMTHPSELVRELYCKMGSQRLEPKVLVSYLREPYVYAPGNVRVTFDSHVRSTLFHRTFLEEEISDIDVFDHPGTMILEVKYDAFLPDIIQAVLQTESICRQAYSKYEACRRYG